MVATAGGSSSASCHQQEEALMLAPSPTPCSTPTEDNTARIQALSTSSEATSSNNNNNKLEPTLRGAARHRPQWQEAVAGGSAGAFSRTAMAPIERIKLLKQLQGSLALEATPTATKSASTTVTTTTARSAMNAVKNNPSAWSLARHVYQTEGLWSFWRGNLPSCLRVSGTAAINFTCMQYYKVAAVQPLLDSGTSLSPRKAQFWSSLIAGGLAGATSTTVLYPLEFVRTRLAVDLGKNEKQLKKEQRTKKVGTTSSSSTVTASTTNKTRQYRGMRHVLVDILRLDGIRGLYQGYGIALTGGIIYRVLYLGGYDAMKKEIAWQRQQTQHGSTATTCADGETSSSSSSSSSTMTWTERFLVAQTISLTAGTISYPFDSVRRRMMMQAGMPLDQRLYRNSLDCIAKVYSKEGLLGFYLGLGPNIVRSMGGALMLVAYDAVRSLL